MANLIEKYPVPLIFKKILKDNIGGELTVKGKNFSKKLFFYKSKLQFASSDLVQDRLGETLCRKGKLSQEQLIMLNRMKEKTGCRFGKLVVHYGLLNKKELFEALQDQVKSIAISTFSLTKGEWTFTISNPKIPGDQKLKIDLYNLIREGNKTTVDFSYYKKRFIFKAPITLPIPENIGQALSSEEIKFYVKLTRCHSISSEEIFSLMKIPDKIFWQRISLMYLLNIVDFTEFRVGSNLNRDIEALNDLYENLLSYSVNHYQLLQLKNTASVNEVKGKYFSFTKRYNADTISTAPDSKTKEKTDFVLRKVKEAYDILSDKDKKKVYDTRPYKKDAVQSTAAARKEFSRKARALYLKAHTHYKERKYYEAIRLLEEAVELDPKRYSYLLLLGLSQSRIPSMRPFAEKSLLKASQMEPWNADPLFYLGQLYWAENLGKKAEKYFRKALEINMEHTLAAKMVRKIEKTTGKRHRFSVFTKKS